MPGARINRLDGCAGEWRSGDRRRLPFAFAELLTATTGLVLAVADSIV